jgi:hypothetical protein
MANINQPILQKYTNEELREIYRNLALCNFELLPKDIASVVKQNSKRANRFFRLCRHEIIRRFVNQINN